MLVTCAGHTAVWKECARALAVLNPSVLKFYKAPGLPIGPTVLLDLQY